MTAILFSILGSSAIFILFKLFGKFKIDVFQAVVFNYFSAFVCGYISFRNDFNQDLQIGDWWYYGLTLGTLFITIFTMMGKSSNSNGIGLTSIATKMSLLISIVFTILYYNEAVTAYKIIGIVSALTAIILTSFPAKGSKLNQTGLLIIIFLGSGVIEIIIGFTNKLIPSSLQSVFTAFSFLFAGCIGIVVLILRLIQKKITLSGKSIIAGLILGIPNFYSIYFIFEALTTSDFSKSSVFGIINISIVVLSFLIGAIVFKEKVKLPHIIGVVLAIGAILFFSI